METGLLELIGILIGLFGILATNIGLFLWLRSEGNNDRREFRQEVRGLAQAIHDEMKDFHGRLCGIEEKYKQLERK